MSCSLCTFPTCPPSSSVSCPTADCGQIFCCQDHLNRWVRYLLFARPVKVKKVWSFEFFTETSDRLQLLIVNVSWFPVFLVSKCSRLVRHRHNFWFPGLYWFWTDALVYSGFWFNWFLSPSQTPNRLVFWFLFWEFLLVNAHCSTAMSNRLAWPSVTIWVIKQVGLTQYEYFKQKTQSDKQVESTWLWSSVNSTLPAAKLVSFPSDFLAVSWTFNFSLLLTADTEDEMTVVRLTLSTLTLSLEGGSIFVLKVNQSHNWKFVKSFLKLAEWK